MDEQIEDGYISKLEGLDIADFYIHLRETSGTLSTKPKFT